MELKIVSPGGAQGTVQPGHGAHFQNLRHAASLHAHQPSRGVLELNFRAGVGVVAQLVFQPLDADGIHRAG